jgi:hypothetical protein
MILHVHVYQPSDGDSFEEFSAASGGGGDDDDAMAATVRELPNRSWEGLWNSLIYAGDIKLKLLDYIHATFVLSDANVDCGSVSHLVSQMTDVLVDFFASQSRFLEPGRVASWSPWNWKNVSLSCSCTKIVYSTFAPVLVTRFPFHTKLNLIPAIRMPAY